MRNCLGPVSVKEREAGHVDQVRYRALSLCRALRRQIRTSQNGCQRNVLIFLSDCDWSRQCPLTRCRNSQGSSPGPGSVRSCSRCGSPLKGTGQVRRRMWHLPCSDTLPEGENPEREREREEHNSRLHMRSYTPQVPQRQGSHCRGMRSKLNLLYNYYYLYARINYFSTICCLENTKVDIFKERLVTQLLPYKNSL